MKNLKLKDLKATTVAAPQSLRISDVAVGDVNPYLRAGALYWHAVIRPHDVRAPLLFQGHGSTPESAVITAVIVARQDLKEFTDRLIAVEHELGLSGKSADELREMIR